MSSRVKLIPTDDFAYLDELTMSYEYDEGLPFSDLEKSMIRHLHKIFVDGELTGVIFLTECCGKFFLDAYKDKRARKSLFISILILNEFFSCISIKNIVIYALVNKLDKKLTFFLNKVGFNYERDLGVDNQVLFSKQL